MEEDIKWSEKNDAWQLVKKPNHRKVTGLEWVYKNKVNFDGSINKQKARLFVKGYDKEASVDYTHMFAPIVRHDTIRILIALAAQRNWTIYWLDVKPIILNGVLENEIYVE